MEAYHDMATHDVSDGSGGMDASIRLELDRPEVRSLCTHLTHVSDSCGLCRIPAVVFRTLLISCRANQIDMHPVSLP